MILLYLESFGNPRKFSRIARRIGMSKPIIAVKSGRIIVGQQAARATQVRWRVPMSRSMPSSSRPG